MLTIRATDPRGSVALLQHLFPGKILGGLQLCPLTAAWIHGRIQTHPGLFSAWAAYASPSVTSDLEPATVATAGLYDAAAAFDQLAAAPGKNEQPPR